MITLYGHGTPNPTKISIALEEMGLPYKVELVDIFSGAGQHPDFLKLSPAGKIPAITDNDSGETIFESNAILLYLAEKSGKLAPSDVPTHHRLLQLLFLQASLQGPMFGQRAHFSLFAPETVPYGIGRYEQQGAIIDGVVDNLLGDAPFLLGDTLSIVDVSFFGWYLPASRSGFIDASRTRLTAWFERVAARPAVKKGIAAFPTIALPDRRILAA